MAGDWIKMRSSLTTHPKVTVIAKLLESDRVVGKALSTGFGGALREIVTRNVTRDVTLACLFRVWCAANDHTTDGVWHGIELDDLDHVAGIPGFGTMMETVGWAVFDADNKTVTFPNFLEYNAPAKEGRASGAAERQRRYRERRRQNDQKSDVTRDVTLRVTSDVTSDVEKRREEKSNKRRENAPPEVSKSESWTIPERLDTPKIRELLAAFAQMRKQTKKPIADLANASRILDRFDDAEHLTYAIEFCIANEYQGLKPDYRPSKRVDSEPESEFTPPKPVVRGEVWIK